MKNANTRTRDILVAISLSAVIFDLGCSNISYGQGVQKSREVNVEGPWYLGKGTVDDESFIHGIQFLIKESIIII